MQVRSHAQKHFLKLQKAGSAEVVPPARPKRRSDRPYPVQESSGKKSRRAVPSIDNYASTAAVTETLSGEPAPFTSFLGES